MEKIENSLLFFIFLFFSFLKKITFSSKFGVSRLKHRVLFSLRIYLTNSQVDGFELQMHTSRTLSSHFAFKKVFIIEWGNDLFSL